MLQEKHSCKSIPPMSGAGWPGIRFSNREESPFWSRIEALVTKWPMVSPSSCPVCLAKAEPSFFSCSMAT